MLWYNEIVKKIPKGAYIMRIIPFCFNNDDCESQKLLDIVSSGRSVVRTVRILADKLVELEIVEYISYVTVQRILKKLNPASPEAGVVYT